MESKIVELEEGEPEEIKRSGQKFKIFKISWIIILSLFTLLFLSFIIYLTISLLTPNITISNNDRGTSSNSSNSNNTNISDIKSHLLQTYCPYNDLDGLTDNCFKYNQETNKLPVILGTGWDPTTRELKLPFLQLTYDKLNSYDSYLYPDQLVINDKTNGTSYRERLYESRSAYLNSLKNYSATEIMAEILDTRQLLYQFESDLNMIALISEYTNYFEISFEPSQTQIISHIAKIIDTLPDLYDPIVYRSFLDKWGTHIIMSATIGRYDQHVLLIRNCYSELNNTKLLEYAKRRVLHQEISTSFFNYSRLFMTELYGTTERKPLLNKIHVVPITNFISDKNKRMNLQRAIDELYLDQRTIVDNLITSLKTKKPVSYFSTHNTNVSCLSTFELDLNQSHSIDSIDETQCSPTLCQRTLDGDITSRLNTDAQYVFSREQTARSGCVGNNYGRDNVWGYCCIDCVPHIDENNRFIGCDCPRFASKI